MADPLSDAVSRYNTETGPETASGPEDMDAGDKGNTIQVPKNADGTYHVCFRVENDQLVVVDESAEEENEPASVPDATGNSLS